MKPKRRPRLRLVTPPKPKAEGARGLTVRTPAGFCEGDEITSVEFCDHTHAPEFYAGDIAVLYHTADVLPDDLAAVEIDGGAWFGVYRPAPGGWLTFERRGGVRRYRPGEARLLGRIVHVERDGEITRRLRRIR